MKKGSNLFFIKITEDRTRNFKIDPIQIRQKEKTLVIR